MSDQTSPARRVIASDACLSVSVRAAARRAPCSPNLSAPQSLSTAVHMEEPPSASVLPDEVIARVLSLLVDIQDLANAEFVCAGWRRVAAESGAWWALACRSHPELAPFGRDAPVCLHAAGSRAWKPTPAALCKRLAALAASPPLRSTVVAEALAASSTDNAEEHVRNTLSRRTRNTVWQLPAYWSSAGSERQDADDWVQYRLASHVCVVAAVGLRPFRAFFQYHTPIYSPLSARVMLGALCEDAGGYGAAGDAPDDGGAFQAQYVSPEFPVAQADELQTLTLPAPVVCVGGVLRVQLCGRAQTQAADNRFYVCLAHLNATGKPWYGFSPSDNGRGLVFDSRGALAGAAARLGGSSESESDSSEDEDDDEPEPMQLP